MRTLFATLALFISTSAFATSYYTDTRYLASFQFDAIAFGQPVREVMVHAGVLESAEGYGQATVRKWMDVKDLMMSPSPHGFFAKGLFKHFDTGNSGSRKIGLGLIVQYWITFQDGSTMITEPRLHTTPGTRSCGPNFYRDELAALRAETDSTETRVEKFGLYGDACRDAEFELAPAGL